MGRSDVNGRSLRTLLGAVAAARPEAAALLAPGRGTLTYAALLAAVDRVGDALAGRVAPDGRIAIVAPDSSAVALTMIGVMSRHVLTPLDGRLTREELARQLTRLRASLAIVVGPAEVARAAAADAGVAVATLLDDGALGGLEALPRVHPIADAARGGADVALVACTSGTTGQPKLVPLTQDNLLSMMIANVDVVGLTPDDRCLGIMPLCHIHGSGAVLCALLAGGSVAVLPASFHADAFFDGLREFSPTWYTAVPTIHQAVLGRAETRADVVAASHLRLVRSGSAPMPAGIPERLESTFRATYVEASGATEASAYLCSNRPATRRIGSVGRAMPGTTLRIVDDAGSDVAPGEVGELVARGPGVFAGYEDASPETTRDAFTADGFFRTGDLARVDADGFFHLVGRLKEQINRGGMKVAPAEVERVLLAHPAVAQAAAFGIADARLGQEVGACVVLRDDAACAAIELQRHAAEHLAEFKVPRHVRFVDAIPVGPRGKVERLRLATQLGLEDDAAKLAGKRVGWSPPVTPMEQSLAAIWTEVLGVEVRDVAAPFFAVGGDSAQALSVCLSIERRFNRPMPLAAIGARPSIRALAELLADDGIVAEPGAPIVIRDGDPTRTLFVLPGVGGNVYSFHLMARHLPADLRIVGLPLPGADGLEAPLSTMAGIAERFVAHVRAQQPRGGPYALAGYSFGGRIACEVARRLVDADPSARVFVALLDARGPDWPPPRPLRQRVAAKLLRQMKTVGPGGKFRAAWPARIAPPRERSTTRPRETTPAEIVAEVVAPLWLPEPLRRRQQAMIAACDAANEGWRAPPLAGLDVRLFRASTPTWVTCDLSDHSMGWRKPSRGAVRIVDVPGSHVTMLHEPHVATLATRLAEAMATPASS